MTPRTNRILALGVLAGFTALAALLVYGLLVAPALSFDAQASVLKRQIVAYERLAARMDGLRQEMARVRASGAGADFAIPAGAPGIAAAQSQALLTQTLTHAGANVQSSESQAPISDGGLIAFPVTVSFEADHKQLTKALHDLGALRPLVIVKRISVRDPNGEVLTGPAPTGPHRLQVEILAVTYGAAP